MSVSIGKNGMLVPQPHASGVVIGAKGTLVPRPAHPVDGFQQPAPVKGEPTPMDGDPVVYQAAHGTLFNKGGPNWNDVVQGPTIGDCYFVSSLSETALQDPSVIKNMIKDNGNGTYTVTFHDTSNGDKPVHITIDDKLPEAKPGTKTPGPLDPSGTPWYASGRNPDRKDGKGLVTAGGDTNDLWPALIEKAYAQWQGGYDAIGNGGDPAQALEQITGKRSSDDFLDGSNTQQIFNEVTQDLKTGQEVVAGSSGTDPDWTQTGIPGDHAYAVLATRVAPGKTYTVKAGDNLWDIAKGLIASKQAKGTIPEVMKQLEQLNPSVAKDPSLLHVGQKLELTKGPEEIELRNPWGQVDPQDKKGGGDGIYWLTTSQFAEYFDMVSTTSGKQS